MSQLDPKKPLPGKDFLGSLPKAQRPKLDLTKAENIKCAECGNWVFDEALLLKDVPAIMSESGREEVIKIPVMSCRACGAIPERFLKISPDMPVY